MKKKTNHSLKSLWLIAAALFVVVAVVLAVSITEGTIKTSGAESGTDPQIVKGTTYIEKMEAVSTAAIEEKILSEEQEKMDEERIAQILSDPDQIFPAIRENNVVLVGESRTSGFSAYGFLDENHVLGGIGWSILEIPALYNQIAALQPSHIVFCFGINELPHELGTPVYIPTPEIYMETLQQSFDIIQDLVPDAKIYMNCIVPCSELGYQLAPGFTVIPEWNAYIEQYCAEHGYGYIDVSDLCEEYEYMYREDGTHLISDFYPYWGARILEAVLRSSDTKKQIS